MNFRTAAKVALAAVCAAALSACNDLQQILQPDPTQPDDEIVIGVVNSLTGDGASSGEAVLTGMELAREEVNNSQILGASIRFIIEDSESDATVAAEAFKKLIHEDNVSLILGPGFSSAARVAFPIAQENQVVAFSPTAGAAGLGAIGDYVFRAPTPANLYSRSLVEQTKEKLGYQKVALIYDSSDFFSQSVHEEAVKALNDLGVETAAVESFETGETDFTAHLNRIQNANPDALFISTRPLERATIPIQANELGVSDTIRLIVLGGVSSAHIEMAGDAAEGIITGSTWSKHADTPGNQAFIQNYRAKYNVDPGGFAVGGYLTVQVLTAALRNAGSTDAAAIRDALAAIDTPTIVGQFAFDGNGDPDTSVFITIIENGEYKILD